MIWQPFAAVSVWHEFGPSSTATYATCSDKAGRSGLCGSCGQRSPWRFQPQPRPQPLEPLGNTPWASRPNSRAQAGSALPESITGTGPNLQGLSGTGGIRYQFTPEAIAQTRMPTKGPAIPIVTAVNWTGFYVGAFGGGVLGTADWNFAGGSASPHVGGYLWGGDIGYNYQFGQWVLGVEADFGKTNLNGGTACAPLLSGTNSGAECRAHVPDDLQRMGQLDRDRYGTTGLQLGTHVVLC